MTISEIVAVLQKASQVAGDVSVVLHDAETGVAHELVALHIRVPNDSSLPATVGLEHAVAAPAPPVVGAGPLYPGGTAAGSGGL